METRHFLFPRKGVGRERKAREKGVWCDMTEIKRFVGVEGRNNCGKSMALRLFIRWLIEVQSGIVAAVYSSGGRRLKIEDLDLASEKDYTVVININGKVVVIVMAGDFYWMPQKVIEILMELDIKIDVVYASLREGVCKKRAHPPVKESYFSLLKKSGVTESQIKIVYKTRKKEKDDSVFSCENLLFMENVLCELLS